MNSFRGGKLESFQFSNGIAKLLEEVSIAQGRESLLATTEPAILTRLRKSSIVTSSTSSCAIEGINVAEAQAREVIEEVRPPGNRQEREVLNYKKALDFIFSEDMRGTPITPGFIRAVHRLCMEGNGWAGQFKEQDNQITEEVNGVRRLRFTPVAAKDTETYLDSLCLSYQESVSKGSTPVHASIGAFVLDFTCIHPFRDGNGRVSRLLTTAAMLQNGAELPRYISIEEVIDQRSDNYYLALKQSSEGWHMSQHNLAPILRFHLESVAQGYQALDRKRQRIDDPLSILFQSRLPVNVIERSKAEITEIYPNASFEVREELPCGREVHIDGFKTDLPEAEFERLNHAKRLAESVLLEARTALKPFSVDTRLVSQKTTSGNRPHEIG